jgi:hypothetical protein
MLQRDGEVMMVLVMMMIMIPMKPSLMTVMMAMISLLREGISPVAFCLPESFFSLSLSQFSTPQRRRNISLMALPVLGFWDNNIREGALAEVGQGRHTTWPHGLAWPAPRGGVGPWWPTSASPSGYLHHLAK